MVNAQYIERNILTLSFQTKTWCKLNIPDSAYYAVSE